MLNLRAILDRYDPDLILTAWGDTWLLPRLLELCKETGLSLPLNRDPAASITHKEQRTYYAYGQVIYRGAQIHLAGRWHIDIYNAVMYHDYGVEGILELARITGLPVQTDGACLAWHRHLLHADCHRPAPGSAGALAQAAGRGAKTVLDLVRSDMGGLVYQPTIGLHADVAEIDFVSMYPSVMAHFNISPETIIPGRA